MVVRRERGKVKKIGTNVICDALNDKREVPKILLLMVHTETHKTLLIKEEPTQKNWGKKWKVQYFSGKRKAENKKFRIKRKKIWRGKQKREKKRKEERNEERRKERREKKGKKINQRRKKGFIGSKARLTQ